VATKTLPESSASRQKRAEGASPPERRSRRLWKAIRHELRTLFPIWLFFFSSFYLLRLTHTAILEEYKIHTFPPSQVLVGSLIIAKVFLLADKLRFVKRCEDRPVVVSAYWKGWIYVGLVFLFEYAEDVFDLRHLGFAKANEAVVARFSTLRFWLMQVWLVILIVGFILHREFIRKIGRERFREVFLGR